MAYRRVDKNKLLGIGLVIFFSFLLVMWLLPNRGIDGWVTHPEQIDSIHVVRNPDNSRLRISDRPEIEAIAAEIRKCREVKVKSLRLTNFKFLVIMYSRHGKSELDFLDGTYDGKIVWSGRIGYKNDTLWQLINAYYQRIGPIPLP